MRSGEPLSITLNSPHFSLVIVGFSTSRLFVFEVWFIIRRTNVHDGGGWSWRTEANQEFGNDMIRFACRHCPQVRSVCKNRKGNAVRMQVASSETPPQLDKIHGLKSEILTCLENSDDWMRFMIIGTDSIANGSGANDAEMIVESNANQNHCKHC